MVELIALGPLELRHNGRRYTLGPLKNRRVLAVLLHARGKPVSVETLMARVWGESEFSDNSVATMRSYLSKLRRQLDEAGLGERLPPCESGGYRLIARPDEVDVLRFEQLGNRARAAAARGDAETAIGLLRDAEALWRGEPLPEFTANEWAASVRSRLAEDLVRVKEQRIGLELERGGHADLIGELQELVAQNPFAQQAVYSWMLALYRSGRHADALKVYQDTYRRFDDELGTPPSARLQRLNRQIIEQDPALDLPAAPTAAATPGPAATSHAPPARPATSTSPVVCNLPRDTSEFTGRAFQLATLLGDFRSPEDDDHATAPPVYVLYGMPGIGKTATAVRAAHSMAHRFPDGVHYVNLRGYSETAHCDPHEALAILLRTSGAATELPESLDERAAWWREWTARHDTLVVLDNACETRQVAPLLPVAPSCRAIVTSRVRLPGLDGARDVLVDALSTKESMRLFRRVAGASRTTDDAALRRVVEACGRHPLALQLLAGRYRHRTSWDLEYLHKRLTQSHDPLSEFDPSLAQAFQFSYTELTAQARLLLRRLALHTGPVITLGGVSALLGTDPSSARAAVEALQDAHLLSEEPIGCFSLHDLVRAFAVQACRREEPEAAARCASRRLLAYYLHSADRADRLANPRRRRLRILTEPDERPVHPEEFDDENEASGWLDLERTNLLAAARTAVESAPRYVPRFAHVLAATLKLWGARRVAARLHSQAVDELRDGIERRSLAQALTDRADILAQERPSDALDDASEALAIYEQLSDEAGCADALLQMGRVHVAAGRNQEALDTLHRPLRLYRSSGDLFHQAETLNVQGVALHYLGDHAAAQERFRLMLTLARRLDDPHLESQALNNLGDLALLEERHDDAREYFEQARDLNRRFGSVRSRAIVECNLAAIYKISGEPERALSALRRALDTYRDGGDTSGEADTLVTLGETYAEMNRRQEALLHFTRAEEVSRGIENGYEQQRALIGIADVQRASGRANLARATYERALRIARNLDYSLGSARAMDGLAHTATHSPDGRDAARAYGEEALTIYAKLGSAAEAATLKRFLLSTKATGS